MSCHLGFQGHLTPRCGVSELQISILIDWDYLLMGRSELHSYHDYESPLMPHGHHSSLRTSASILRSRKDAIYLDLKPLLLGSSEMPRPRKNIGSFYIVLLNKLSSLHFPGLPREKTTLLSPKKKEEAQIKNERIQNNPQFSNSVNLTVLPPPHISLDQTPP